VGDEDAVMVIAFSSADRERKASNVMTSTPSARRARCS
jgi:hypothetical protein